MLDGKALSAEEIKKLADLESREVLLAKLAGAMKATLSGAAALFEAPLSQFARTVEALRQQREASLGGPSVEGGAEHRRRRRRRRSHRPPDAPAIRTGPLAPHHHHGPPHGRTAIMAKLSKDDLLDSFEEMTLIELSEFVKQFEEKFDVTAAAPVAVAAAPVQPLPARPPRRPSSRTSSTSSSRAPATRRSRSSRWCVS